MERHIFLQPRLLPPPPHRLVWPQNSSGESCVRSRSVGRWKGSGLLPLKVHVSSLNPSLRGMPQCAGQRGNISFCVYVCITWESGEGGEKETGKGSRRRRIGKGMLALQKHHSKWGSSVKQQQHRNLPTNGFVSVLFIHVNLSLVPAVRKKWRPPLTESYVLKHEMNSYETLRSPHRVISLV